MLTALVVTDLRGGQGGEEGVGVGVQHGLGAQAGAREAQRRDQLQLARGQQAVETPGDPQVELQQHGPHLVIIIIIIIMNMTIIIILLTAPSLARSPEPASEVSCVCGVTRC